MTGIRALSQGSRTFTFAKVGLENEAERIFNALRQARHLTNLPRREFCDRAGRLLAEVNRLHPFREGNGRTQRIFLTDLGRHAAHPLSFDVVSKERMVQASVLAHIGDPAMMTRIIHEIADPANVTALRQAITYLEQQRFNWNNAYIATVTPGEHYAGILVGRSATDFMMRTDRDQIIIGNRADLAPGVRNEERFSLTARTPPGIPEQHISEELSL